MDITGDLHVCVDTVPDYGLGVGLLVRPLLGLHCMGLEFFFFVLE